jgi:hypothetical protein
MPTISLKEAVTKAEALIATKRTQHPCGALQAIHYEPANGRDTARKNGTYRVEFFHSGPTAHASSHPRGNPPTVVLVNDKTGKCSILVNKPEKTPRQSSSRKSPAKKPAPSRGFKMGSAIPVLRMLDEAEAKAFYLDYLGFQVDWEGRQSLTSPLYMQIRLGDALLHLDGHAGEDAPISQVIIQVVGLQQYCDYLIAMKAEYPKPWPVDPRYQGRNTDMNIDDPFGNYLIFCSQTTEG